MIMLLLAIAAGRNLAIILFIFMYDKGYRPKKNFLWTHNLGKFDFLADISSIYQNP